MDQHGELPLPLCPWFYNNLTLQDNSVKPKMIMRRIILTIAIINNNDNLFRVKYPHVCSVDYRSKVYTEQTLISIERL